MIINSSFDLRNGSRILVSDAKAKHGDDPMFGVYFRPSDILPYIECENGMTYRASDHGYDASEAMDGIPKRVFVAWSLPLPDLPDPEIIAFYHNVKVIADHIQKTRYYQHPALFYIDAIDGDVAQAKLVYSMFVDPSSSGPDSDGEKIEELEEYFGPVVAANYPIMISTKELPEGVAPGSLVLTNDFSCKTFPATAETAERVMTSPEVCVELARNISFSDLHHYIPYKTRPHGQDEAHAVITIRQSGFPTATVGDHLDQIDMARSRHEPDVALVLAVDEGKRGCTMVPISHLGIQMFQLDDLRDHFDDRMIEPGLWLFKNARFHAWSYETDCGREYDTALDGTYVRATEADLDLFGLTLEDVGREAAEYLFSEEEVASLDFVSVARSQFLAPAVEPEPVSGLAL